MTNNFFNNDPIAFMIFLIFSIFIIFFWWKDKSSCKYNQIIFTLGILGTFAGISWGLYKFNTENIQDSIPSLLGGLKTAFLTSMLGMICTIYNQWRSKAKNNHLESKEQSEYIYEIYRMLKSTMDKSTDDWIWTHTSHDENIGNIDNNVAELLEINSKINGNEFQELLRRGFNQLNNSIQEGNQEIKNGFNTMIKLSNNNLKSGIEYLSKILQSGNNEIKNGFESIIKSNKESDFLLEGISTQVDQGMKEGINGINNGFKNVDILLKKISDDISQGASRAIVEALEKAMRDFNQNLEKSFGENFKQLNHACLKMIKWQDEYKNQVNRGIDNLNALNNTLVNSANVHEKIVKNSQESIKVSRKVEQLIEGCNGHIEVMSKLLKEYGELSQDAKNMFKTTSDGFRRTNDLMDKFSGGIQVSLKAQSQAVTNLTREIEEKLPELLAQLDQRLADATKKFAEMYENLLSPMKSQK